MKFLFKAVYYFVESMPHRLSLLLLRLGLIEKYQPLWNMSHKNAERECQDRWEIIRKQLPKAAFSFLDTGSQLGYFTFSAAKEGGVAIGLERVRTFYNVAQAVKFFQKIENINFLNMELNSETVKSLPSFDVVCCMSVFHHWVMDWGYEGADQILTDLASKAQTLIFETGQNNESTQAFSKSMNFMGDDHQAWVTNYLKTKGFQTVDVLGEFDTHLSPVKRVLYCAKR